MKKLSTIITSLTLLSASLFAQNSLKTQEQQVGYVLGIEIGKQLIVSKDDIDLKAMSQGMEDVFSGNKPKLTNAQMQDAMMKYQTSKKIKESAMQEKFVSHNKKEGEAFLAANKKKKGVITLASGLQYNVIKKGSGKVFPKPTDTVVTNYHGTLINGTVFDSSYDRGQAVSFPVNAVIKGWSEALVKMKAGDKWHLVIPSHLAYGEQGAPPSISPGATLVFDVELLEIK